MPRQGRDLERLVELLEKAFLQKDDVTVESPGFLADRVTGNQREFDVVVRKKLGHHDVVLAFECRDRGRPVGVPDIEGFITKSADCRIDHRIVVSSSGFADTAKQKAEYNGIRCLQIEECENLDWIWARHLSFHQRTLKSANWLFNASPETLKKKPVNFEIVDAEGRQATKEVLQANLLRIVDQNPEWKLEGKNRIILPGTGLFIRDIDDDSRVPVNKILVDTEFEYTTKEIPLAFATYRGIDPSEKIGELAVADVNEPGFQGKLVIANNPEKGGAIYVVRSPNKQAKTPDSDE